jgi:hypothetical protein
MVDYIRDLRPAEWGGAVSLRDGNPEPLRSALGQKRTWALARDGTPAAITLARDPAYWDGR